MPDKFIHCPFCGSGRNFTIQINEDSELEITCDNPNCGEAWTWYYVVEGSLHNEGRTDQPVMLADLKREEDEVN